MNCCHGLTQKKNCELGSKGFKKTTHYTTTRDGRIQVYDNCVTIDSVRRINGYSEREECLLDYGKGYWSGDMCVCSKCTKSECSESNPLLMCSIVDCSYVCHYDCMDTAHSQRFNTNKSKWLCPECFRDRARNVQHFNRNLLSAPPERTLNRAKAAAASVSFANCSDDDEFSISPPRSPISSSPSPSNSDDEVQTTSNAFSLIR